MNTIDQLITDLKTAARYLLLDGASMDEEEAVRIGIVLAEFAGTLHSSAAEVEEQRKAA